MPENYNEETGWALVLEDFFDCCEALTRKGIELTKDVFANGFDQAIIQDLVSIVYMFLSNSFLAG